jgi:hypothetical protein
MRFQRSSNLVFFRIYFPGLKYFSKKNETIWVRTEHECVENLNS